MELDKQLRGTKMYTCDVNGCGFKTKYRQSLWRHKKTKHKNIDEGNIETINVNYDAEKVDENDNDKVNNDVDVYEVNESKNKVKLKKIEVKKSKHDHKNIIYISIFLISLLFLIPLLKILFYKYSERVSNQRMISRLISFD